ncbi:amidohydrolase [Sediminivirga luteola]|uniref:Putative amidohydrolase n=1 Tax=Sediminivirga luteola TaxID=1774748 RepID=A0A8J2XGN4_9MICO|nr:amidohydrolase [Sediminivirga luteola]MCI2265856.1 amidohydrolase [Sediminivirga luteola]GGA14106.1 putative amidohydrolase [Sediminivirga luteola]
MTDTLTAFALSDEERARAHELYKAFHADPELSMQEHRTQERIEGVLDELGIEHFRCGGTGVVGLIRNGEGPVVGFRADTDGLPIEEATGLDYASTARGTLEDGTDVPVMHGCGHDTHITSLLTAVRVLLREKDRWAGTVVLIFQPGEETSAGARAMVDDGLWDKAPRPEVILGQHVWPGQAGTVSLTRGTAMAMADSLRVTVRGKQSHGSQPQNSIDPIVLASAMVQRLQTVVSRELSPLDSAVVTVGTFHAGLKENIIPDKAEFTLNIRSLTPEVRAQVLAAVQRIITGEAQVAGAPEPVVEKIYDFPANVNDDAATERVFTALRAGLGEANVEEMPPKMGSEDFGWLGEAIGVPTVYWFFGGYDAERLASGDVPVNHSPYFGPVIEPTLTTGTNAVLAGLLEWIGK